MGKPKGSEDPKTSQEDTNEDVIELEEGLEGSPTDQETAKPTGFTDEEWEAVPSEARPGVSRREKDREAYFTRRSQELAEQEKTLQNLMTQANEITKSSRTPPEEKKVKVPDLRDIDYQDPVQFQDYLHSVVQTAIDGLKESLKQDFSQSFSDRDQKSTEEQTQRIWGEFVQEHPEAKEMEREMVGLYMSLPSAGTETAMRKNLERAFGEAKDLRELRKQKSDLAKKKVTPESSRGVNRETTKSTSSVPPVTIKDAFEETVKEMEEAGLSVPEDWKR